MVLTDGLTTPEFDVIPAPAPPVAALFRSLRGADTNPDPGAPAIFGVYAAPDKPKREKISSFEYG